MKKYSENKHNKLESSDDLKRIKNPSKHFDRRKESIIDYGFDSEEEAEEFSKFFRDKYSAKRNKR